MQRLIERLKAHLLIWKGILSGKSMQQLLDEAEDELAQLIHENRKLNIELQAHFDEIAKLQEVNRAAIKG